MTESTKNELLIPISDCPVCSKLAETEHALYKYGWDELSTSLPIEAGQLAPIEELNSYDKENDHIRQCPYCGTYYHYKCTYEYLVNGSEDDVVLTRLTPTQAKILLTNDQYERLIAAHEQNLVHPEAHTRSYTAKCMFSRYLETGNFNAIAVLLTYPDTAVIKGVLNFMVKVSDGNEQLLLRIPGLQEILTNLAAGPEEELANPASYLLRYSKLFKE